MRICSVFIACVISAITCAWVAQLVEISRRPTETWAACEDPRDLRALIVEPLIAPPTCEPITRRDVARFEVRRDWVLVELRDGRSLWTSPGAVR